jgi:hypothetical protein
VKRIPLLVPAADVRRELVVEPDDECGTIGAARRDHREQSRRDRLKRFIAS